MMDATATPRRTLRTRLGFALSVALLAPACAILAFHALSAAQDARADADTALTRSVVALHAHVEQHLDQQTQGLARAAETLARSPLRPIAGQPEPGELADWLSRYAADLPAFDGLFVTDAAGRVAAVTASTATAAVAVRNQYVERDFFREPMRGGEPYVSGLFAAHGQQVLVLTVPIPLAPGQPAGVIGGVLRRSAFDGLARDVRGDATQVRVLDPSGFQIAVADMGAESSRSQTRASGVGPLVAAVTPTDGVPFWYATPGGDETRAAVRQSARGWRTAATMPRDTVYAPAWRAMLIALLVTAGGLALAGAILVPLTGRAMRPLERLVDDARTMQATLEQQVVTRTAELSDARDHAEREARLKGVFLAAMSHEIRTPMNSIVGMAELMAETPLDGEQREYCDTIRTSTDALLGVINDILDFSKIEAQGVSLETLDFDLRVVVEDAVELLGIKAATTGLDLAAIIEPGFDGRFRGDPSRLRQVVVNLLGNAIKFTARGSVTVRVSTMARAATESRVRLEVVDTGIGMTPEGIARLFRPFAQAEESTAGTYGGTGLGLTISKQIVERMGGVIGVDSTPGQGSTFWLEIPFPPSAAIAAAPPLARPVANALVLEPLDASGEALRRLLTELGVRATRVTTAGDGLGALDAHPAGFAVVFVGADAIDAAPFVDALQHRTAPAPPIVALVPANRRRASDLDRLACAHRLARPLRRARLVECLEALTSQRQPAGSTPNQVSLPAPAPAAAAPAPAVVSTGAARILVADDYFANQRLVTRLLEKRGYVVEAVTDGQGAIDAILDRPFDLVLMDCNMPILDGYAATARIRALDHRQHTPILAMTANDSPEDRDTCLQAGMDDYLVKPIQAVKVLAAVERWVAIGRERAAAALEPAGGPGGPR
jgi:signal transduction histidine kinase/CheY-like chemotaxis protein